MPLESDIESTLDQAIASHEARAFDRAERLYRDVLAADPDHPDALNLLGVVLQDTERAAESIASIERAIAIEPDFPEAFANLARGLNALARSEEALAAARKATAGDPTLGEAWFQAGLAHFGLGQDREALHAFEQAQATGVDSVELRMAIAAATERSGDHVLAAEIWDAVLLERPDNLHATIGLGTSLGNLKETDAALELHRKAVAMAPDDNTALYALAVTLFRQRYDCNELRDVCLRILTTDPDHVDTLLMLAAALTWLGQFDEAREVHRKVLALRPDHPDGPWLLASVSNAPLPDDSLNELRAQFADTSLPMASRIAAVFALGKSLDRAGAYDEAFLAFKAGNDMARQEVPADRVYDRPAVLRYFEQVTTLFTPALFERHRSLGHPSELPVFIVGMPRSGTTLVEQIAASHPAIHGAGERKDIGALLARIAGNQNDLRIGQWDPGLIAAETARHIAMLEGLGGNAVRVIDKLPDNIQFLGQIALLFPNARIIVCQRDPRDVCFSCFSTHFGDQQTWSFSPEECAARALDIERLTNAWRAVLPGRVTEIRYEELVGDLEAESRRLMTFLGVDWDPACLDFHKTARQVTTASYMQVRQPLYDSSVGRWRSYEKHLGPMLALLAGHPRCGGGR